MLFTERIIVGMGGTRRHLPGRGRDGAALGALGALRALRGRACRRSATCGRGGCRIGLLSNSSRNLAEFVEHHGLVADAVLTSHAHGKTKPHESIFRAVLELLEVEPAQAVMVGDTLHDDIEGALAVGMQAVLLDREGRHPEIAERLARPAGARPGARARIGWRRCARTNVFTPEFDHASERDGYRWRGAKVGKAVGAAQIGACVYELAGRASGRTRTTSTTRWRSGSSCSTGTPTLRDPDGERVLRRGDVVCFPTGPDGAHQVRGRGR